MGQVVKTSTKVEIVILDYHRATFDAANTGRKAGETMHNKLCALLVSRYGAPIIGADADGGETRSGGPTYTQYRDDQSALRVLAQKRKLADNQWFRKSYAAAVKATYGSIPESQDAAAIAKRAQRDAAKATQAAQTSSAPAPAGAPKGETRQPSPEEVAEQLVTRIGIFPTLDACLRILKADKSTEAQAVHIEKMVAKAREAVAKAQAPKAQPEAAAA